MTKHFLRIALCTVPLVAGCKKDGGGQNHKPVEGNAAPAQPEAPIELAETADLGAAITDPDNTAYRGLKVKVPAGATIEAGLTGVLIQHGGKGMEIARAWQPGEHVAKEKAEAKTDTLDKLVKFHVDTPDAVLWESKSELTGDANFLFAAEVVVGADSYKCSNGGYGRFQRNEADALLESCRSLSK